MGSVWDITDAAALPPLDIPYLPLIFVTSHRSMVTPLDPVVVLASIAQRFCAPTTIPRRRPGALHTCLSPGATACRCEGGRALGVPAVDPGPVGASKERYLDYVYPHRGCDPQGFLYGFEARI